MRLLFKASLTAMPFDDDDRDRARSGKVLFHHASYVGPAVVVREEAKVSSPLVESKYRVVGKLFTDDALVEAWIRGTPVPTRLRGQR